MEISVHSNNKHNNITINSSVILDYTQEQNNASLKTYLFEGLIL